MQTGKQIRLSERLNQVPVSICTNVHKLNYEYMKYTVVNKYNFVW